MSRKKELYYFSRFKKDIQQNDPLNKRIIFSFLQTPPHIHQLSYIQRFLSLFACTSTFTIYFESITHSFHYLYCFFLFLSYSLSLSPPPLSLSLLYLTISVPFSSLPFSFFLSFSLSFFCSLSSFLSLSFLSHT